MDTTTNRILLNLGFECASEVKHLVKEVGTRLKLDQDRKVGGSETLNEFKARLMAKQWEDKYRDEKGLATDAPLIVPSNPGDSSSLNNTGRSRTRAIFYGEHDDVYTPSDMNTRITERAIRNG